MPPASSNGHSTLSESHVSQIDIYNQSRLLFDLSPCLFQIHSCDLQLRGEHSILISPTGSGKSLTCFLPFIWQKTGITILICPLQLLGQQHATSDLLEKLKIKSINLTALTATNAAFKEIERGYYQLVVASPEYIAEDSRFLKLWRSTTFTSQIRRLIFDEAHCVSQWGDFRKAYKNLCFIRYLAPSAVVLALSATLPPRVLTEVRSLLGLPRDVQIVHRSNDRSNICVIVAKMCHSVVSLLDTGFLIPDHLDYFVDKPPSFLLFMQTKELCQRGGNFLRKRLPPELIDKVVWVHADMSREHNEKALADLKAGRIFGIVCTEVVGMGIDISSLGIVAQYQLTESMSILWQRLGRAGRSGLMQAFGIVLVEKKHFRDEKEKRTAKVETQQRKKRKLAHQAMLELEANSASQSIKVESALPDTPIATPPTTPASPASASTSSKKRSRGHANSKKTKKSKIIEPGLDEFINSHLAPNKEDRCRHKAINKYFNNPTQVSEDDVCCERCLIKSPPSTSCCDVCNPQLASNILSSMTSPTKKSTGTRRAKLLPTPDSPNDVLLRSRLKVWREETASKKWGPFFIVGGLGILADTQVERIVGLARLGLLPDTAALKAQLKWCFHSEYGAEVITLVQAVHPPPPPQPSATLHTPIRRKVSASTTPSCASSPSVSKCSSAIAKSEPKVLGSRKCSLCKGTDHISSNLIKCPVNRKRAHEEAARIRGQSQSTPPAHSPDTATLGSPAPNNTSPAYWNPYAPSTPSPLSTAGSSSSQTYVPESSAPPYETQYYPQYNYNTPPANPQWYYYNGYYYHSPSVPSSPPVSSPSLTVAALPESTSVSPSPSLPSSSSPSTPVSTAIELIGSEDSFRPGM